MPVYFYASWLTSKATDFEVETMIKGYDAIKKEHGNGSNNSFYIILNRSKLIINKNVDWNV